jgi:hypothetical protein
MSENTRTCACTVQQYEPIIFNNVGYQNGANTVYQSKVVDKAAATTGTRAAPNGNPIFNSNAERMQYMMGRQNQASCGVPAKAFALGTN